MNSYVSIPDRKYISIEAFLTENMVFFKDVWPWNEFERKVFCIVRTTYYIEGGSKFLYKKVLRSLLLS